MQASYDKTDPESIKAYAQELIGKSLYESISIDLSEVNTTNKGNLGQIIEDFYFHYNPNSNKGPDFLEAGVELKTSPLKKLKNGSFVSKERLVLNIINYDEMYEETWEQSSFLSKNKLLLLMLYLWEEDKGILDYIFKLADLWEFPEQDLKIIKDDWMKIFQKIDDGKAHELSEGDTLFLGACTKGSSSKDLRTQPKSDILAKQRALSIKQKYLNFMIHELANRYYGPEAKQKMGYEFERIVKSIDEYNEGETLEGLVQRRFEPYFGKSIADLKAEFDLNFSPRSKHKAYLITKGILGISSEKKIDEFEKADIEIKTIALESTGTLKESMSFPHIRYNDIIHQKFENSPIYEKLTKRFFFVIFQKDDNGIKRLNKIMFWTMPKKDLDTYKKLFNDTKKKINDGDYENFIKISDGVVGHIRPHGRDKQDLMETPQGTKEIKRCFWLNSKYVKEQIK